MSSVTSQRYAHSLAGRPLEEWQVLEDHLIQTADLADFFASGYAPGWGRIAGLWHDAGKYREAFAGESRTRGWNHGRRSAPNKPVKLGKPVLVTKLPGRSIRGSY